MPVLQHGVGSWKGSKQKREGDAVRNSLPTEIKAPFHVEVNLLCTLDWDSFAGEILLALAQF